MSVAPSKLCVSDERYNLHAATTADAADREGREALLRYILRPPVIVQGPDDLVRIALNKPFSDGTVAVDMDPPSLLLRLCAAVPAPRFGSVRYAGVLASASKLRPKIVVRAGDEHESAPKKPSRYWPWAELMASMSTWKSVRAYVGVEIHEGSRAFPSERGSFLRRPIDVRA